MNNEAETQFIASFIRKEKQDRMKELLPNPKKREKVLSTLDHFRDLDDRYAKPIPSSEQTSDAIYSMLEKMGAPKECHLISSSKKLDGKTMALKEALDSVVGKGNGTLVICIPTKLGYYEGESQNDRRLLKR